MAWKFETGAPVSKQLADGIRLEVLNGNYPPGSQIPPVRQIAIEAGVNPNTVQKSLTMLESEGLLEAHTTIGRFVTTDEKILTEARKALQKEYILRVMKESRALGISKEEFFKLLNESEDTL